MLDLEATLTTNTLVTSKLKYLMTPVEPVPIISNILSANHQLVPDDDQVKVWELQLKLICGAFGDKSPQFGRGRLLGNDLDLPPPPHRHDVFHHMRLASGRVWPVQRDRQVVSFLAALPLLQSGAVELFAGRPLPNDWTKKLSSPGLSYLSLLATYDMSEETSLLIILVVILPIRGLFAYFSWSIS